MKNRNKMEIIARILVAAGKGNNKTKIMYGAYLSSTQLREYLPFLESSRLIKEDKSGDGYRVTEKGRRYLQKYRELDELTIPKISKK